MKRVFLATFLIFCTLPVFAAGPRSWGKSGTATDTNTQVTVGGATTFGPAQICIENTGATNNLYFDWTDGVATTDDNSTNIIVRPDKALCVAFFNPNNVTNVVQIGLITGAGLSTTYNIAAFGVR